jgi:hypothetical protein
MASPYEMRAITDALQAIMEQLNRIEDRIEEIKPSSSVAELDTQAAATTGWLPKASGLQPNPDFGDAAKVYGDAPDPTEAPAEATKTTEPEPEAAPEAKPETAGNTETVGTSRIGAE